MSTDTDNRPNISRSLCSPRGSKGGGGVEGGGDPTSMQHTVAHPPLLSGSSQLSGVPDGPSLRIRAGQNS